MALGLMACALAVFNGKVLLPGGPRGPLGALGGARSVLPKVPRFRDWWQTVRELRYALRNKSFWLMLLMVTLNPKP